MNKWIPAALSLLMFGGCGGGGKEAESAAAVLPPGASQGDAVSEMDSASESESAPKSLPWIPVDFEVPTLVEAPDFALKPLGPELVKIDYDAYMSSIEHLQTTFTRSTRWPTADISDADAMLDMETEQGRFLARKSFAYGVLTPDGKRERGSVYVRPSSKTGYDAEVRMWVTQADFDAGFDTELYAWVKNWIAETWPFETVAYPGREIEWGLWDSLPDAVSDAAVNATEPSEEDGLLQRNLETAEAFIDSFYSFDSSRLALFLDRATKSAPPILWYQGWAEGGNYKVLVRDGCVAESAQTINCPVTVRDDPVVALNTGFDVTDTFSITFEGTDITAVSTSSNDQPIYYEARKWVEKNKPDVMTGPCMRDADRGGPTPGDCARAMTAGYREYYASLQKEG